MTARLPRPPGSVSTQEAARILGVHDETVNRWWAEGLLKTVSAPGWTRCRFFDRADVESLAVFRGDERLPPRRQGLDLTGIVDDELRSRFWSKVNKAGPIPPHRPDLGPCWIWAKYCAKKTGYGQFLLRHRDPRLAHVVSYALIKGPVPPRLHVCHACDNPPCVRPDHLFVGTARDNTLDSVAKGRANRSHGVDHRSARLDDEIVRVIRATPPYHGRLRELARRYGVSDHAIRNVLIGKTWRHVA